MSDESGAGVAVAGGDPGRLCAAACWHETVADSLDGQAALIDHTAGSLITVWQGEAASCYQTLSRDVAAHFRTASDQARSASIILRRYASELERYQQEGARCLAEAEHWQQQAVADRARLARAEQSLHDAQAAVSQARQQLSVSVGAGAAGTGMHPAATGALADAQSKLAAAQATVRDAQRALQDAEDQLQRWQARGRQVGLQALEAGRRASSALESLSPPPPPPPPTAGTPAFVPGGSATGSSTDLGAAAAVSGVVAFASPGDTGAGAGTPAGAGLTAGGPALPPVNQGASQGAITFGDLEEVGRRFGWSQNELQAWWQVISDESGGNPSATNPGSGAFGIGQFLGSTYREYLPYGAGSANPLDQLNAMAQYIHDRYGTPLAALGHENSCHWY